MLFSLYSIKLWKKGIYTEDLGKTKTFNKELCKAALEKVEKFLKKIKEGQVYIMENSTCKPLSMFYENHYYALKQYGEYPILEIDGLRMHLIKEWKTPFHYAKAIIKRLGINKENNEILDCCTGLGYLAIELSKYGNVTTVEKSKAVLTLASLNPFSKELFNNEKIKIINDDVFNAIDDFGLFHYIIHDPPRFSHAPELYSLSFYKKIFSHLHENGKLFHYVGYFGRRRNIKIKESVKKRLIEAGLKPLFFDEKLKGWIAKK